MKRNEPVATAQPQPSIGVSQRTDCQSYTSLQLQLPRRSDTDNWHRGCSVRAASRPLRYGSV